MTCHVVVWYGSSTQLIYLRQFHCPPLFPLLFSGSLVPPLVPQFLSSMVPWFHSSLVPWFPLENWLTCTYIEWKLLYWNFLPGRGEFVRLMFEEAGVLWQCLQERKQPICSSQVLQGRGWLTPLTLYLPLGSYHSSWEVYEELSTEGHDCFHSMKRNGTYKIRPSLSLRHSRPNAYQSTQCSLCTTPT